jgi:hypothetical protein
MDEKIRTFLTEGLKTYREAKATLEFFEQEVSNQLTSAVKARKGWDPLKNPNIKAPEVDGGESKNYGRWVAISIEGKSPRDEDVKIDCGVWWFPEVLSGHLMIYASFTDHPKRLLNFPWTQTNSTVCAFNWFKRTFLYYPLTDPIEIDPALNQLLDEILKQLL